MSDCQLAFDLAERGAALAADKADRVIPGWSDRAFEAFKRYAKRCAFFTTEDVILASPEVPDPAEKRAWGHIALQAKKQGIIDKAGYAVAKQAHSHRRPITSWRSNIFSPPT
jgi:hypothetical protein